VAAGAGAGAGAAAVAAAAGVCVADSSLLLHAPRANTAARVKLTIRVWRIIFFMGNSCSKI